MLKASRLEAHLQATSAEQLREYYDTAEQAACQVQDNVPGEAGVILTFATSTRIIPCPKATVVITEHTLMLRLSTDCYVLLM